MSAPHILVVDDEKNYLLLLEALLSEEGYEVTTMQDPEMALMYLKESEVDVLVTDFKMPGMSGQELLERVRATLPHLPVIIMTAYGSVDGAVEAMKCGAFDYINKPFSNDDLLLSINKAVKISEAYRKNRLLMDSLKDSHALKKIIGSSPAIKKILDLIQKVASTNANVLITGESGTGKELVARAIHYSSSRKDKEFVAVDCSALVETLLESELFGHVKGSFTGAYHTKHGLFELANHGTFFFDEISNLSLNIQAKLLRVIQEREFMKVGDNKKIKVDIRIISASNKDIKEAVEKGEFREDLYYRLSVVPIHLPPLRERKEDIPLLVSHFLKKICKKIKKQPPQVSEEVIEAFKRYPWPGNVRELEHIIERILILEDTDIIKVEHLPSFIIHQDREIEEFSTLPLSLEEMEKRYIKFVLKYTKGKKTEAARILGINRKTLTLKMKKYGLT